jgi:hypothetical protein
MRHLSMGGKDGVGRNCAHASSKPGLISSKKEARLDGWTIMGLARTMTSRVRGNRTIPAVAVLFFQRKVEKKQTHTIRSVMSFSQRKKKKTRHIQ